MKRAILFIALIATPVFAQQVDPEIAAYAELLNEANSRIAALSKQIANLNKELNEANAQIKSETQKLKPADPQN